MRIVIGIACALMLSGCLETSTETDTTEQTGPTEFPPVQEPPVQEPPVQEPPMPTSPAVSGMLLNTRNVDFWNCQSVDNSTSAFRAAFYENGQGEYADADVESEMSWEETTNGVVQVNLIDFGSESELRNFTFISLFEFNVDVFVDDEFFESDTCQLFEFIDDDSGDSGADFLITADSAADPVQTVWQCDVNNGEQYFLSLLGDGTGGIIFPQEDEPLIFEFSSWQSDGDSLETFLDDRSDVFFGLQGIEADSGSLSSSNTSISDDFFGPSSCILIDIEV